VPAKLVSALCFDVGAGHVAAATIFFDRHATIRTRLGLSEYPGFVGRGFAERRVRVELLAAHAVVVRQLVREARLGAARRAVHDGNVVPAVVDLTAAARLA
jgi:hypothetical protein